MVLGDTACYATHLDVGVVNEMLLSVESLMMRIFKSLSENIIVERYRQLQFVSCKIIVDIVGHC